MDLMALVKINVSPHLFSIAKYLSLAKSAQILLVMSDRTDTFRELWVLSILKCVI